jgi:hypothetical protein
VLLETLLAVMVMRVADISTVYTYAAVEVLDYQLAVLNRGHCHEGEPSASSRDAIVQHLMNM